MMREVMHHGGLKHPFIVDLKEVFLTPEYLAIVMEYAQGGNVSSGGRGGGGGSARMRWCACQCAMVCVRCVLACVWVCVVWYGSIACSLFVWWWGSLHGWVPDSQAPAPPPPPQLHRFLRERCLHNRLTEDQARWIFQQMIVGLDFCHRMVRCCRLRLFSTTPPLALPCKHICPAAALRLRPDCLPCHLTIPSSIPPPRFLLLPGRGQPRPEAGEPAAGPGPVQRQPAAQNMRLWCASQPGSTCAPAVCVSVFEDMCLLVGVSGLWGRCCSLRGAISGTAAAPHHAMLPPPHLLAPVSAPWAHLPNPHPHPRPCPPTHTNPIALPARPQATPSTTSAAPPTRGWARPCTWRPRSSS